MNTITKAAKSGDDDKGSRNKITITVVYNGLAKPLEVNSKQSLNAVMPHSLRLFGVAAAPSGFRLLLEATGAELNLGQSVEDAGIVEGTRILLAPRAVSGGA